MNKKTSETIIAVALILGVAIYFTLRPQKMDTSSKTMIVTDESGKSISLDNLKDTIRSEVETSIKEFYKETLGPNEKRKEGAVVNSNKLPKPLLNPPSKVKGSEGWLCTPSQDKALKIVPGSDPNKGKAVLFGDDRDKDITTQTWVYMQADYEIKANFIYFNPFFAKLPPDENGFRKEIPNVKGQWHKYRWEGGSAQFLKMIMWEHGEPFENRFCY